MLLQRQYAKNEDGSILDAKGRALTRSDELALQEFFELDEAGLKRLLTRQKTTAIELARKNNVNAFWLDEDGKRRTPHVVGVNVRNAHGSTWRPSPRQVEEGLAQGWISVGGGKLTVHGSNDAELVYSILRTPGRYCCHCLEPLSGEKEAKAHVADKHAEAETESLDDGNPAETESPDKGNPAGYERINFYDLELEEED